MPTQVMRLHAFAITMLRNRLALADVSLACKTCDNKRRKLECFVCGAHARNLLTLQFADSCTSAPPSPQIRPSARAKIYIALRNSGIASLRWIGAAISRLRSRATLRARNFRGSYVRPLLGIRSTRTIAARAHTNTWSPVAISKPTSRAQSQPRRPRHAVELSER
jgi:hypothetical protein